MQSTSCLCREPFVKNILIKNRKRPSAFNADGPFQILSDFSVLLCSRASRTFESLRLRFTVIQKIQKSARCKRQLLPAFHGNANRPEGGHIQRFDHDVIGMTP